MPSLRQRKPDVAANGDYEDALLDTSTESILRYVDGKRRGGDVDDKRRRGPEPLGFRHWAVAFIVIGCVYGSVVHFHHKLPPVRKAEGYEQFSEERARVFLKAVTDLGPRPSGSEALEKYAVPMLRDRLEQIKTEAGKLGHNRVEIDTHRPTGCFDLKFLSAFTLCYQNVTNVVARLGPASGPAGHALLLNCHIDTMPDTPGATDDAVSCAIMLEILDVLARTGKPLAYDVVFLFNGAEENFLQGAHGFIESHPWRHTIRAFINLEGTGSGGREILFQAGPGNSWLLRAYLDAAPHPYCSVLAQEIFQSGVIPSDTDFRIFRDFGRVSGLDIAYTRNGWVYHTEFDEEWRIEAGSLQRAGDNVLAVVRKVLSEDDLGQPGKAAESNQWVFYDVVGLFTVRYTIQLGVMLNVGTAACTILFVLLRIHHGTYTVADLIAVFGRHLVALIAMAATGATIAAFVVLMDWTMCWYALPELIGGLYVLPMAAAGLYVHALFAAKRSMRNAEMAHSDSVLLLLSLGLLGMTYGGSASAFFLLNYLLFALLRDPILYVLGKIGIIHEVTPKAVLAVQLFSLIPAIVFAAYATSQCVDFFVPVLGRLGNAINPELVMAPLGLVIALTFVLFTNNLVYVSRPLNLAFRVVLLAFVFLLLLIGQTKLGNPYQYSEAHPRLRRIIGLHSQRTIYDFSGVARPTETALFLQALDYRGARDLPAHSFMQGSPPSDCAQSKDEYCRMPYYTAVHELFPPEESVWIPVPGKPTIPFPIQLKLLSRERKGQNGLNLTFELRGGYDKMSLHVTPLGAFSLASWSFTPLDIKTIAKRDTYFVFMGYNGDVPPVRKFSFLLEHEGSGAFPDVAKAPSLELAVASHHAHGAHQKSETLDQLRHLIASRRQTPHMAVGWWKWGITMIGGQSEIVVHQF